MFTFTNDSLVLTL